MHTYVRTYVHTYMYAGTLSVRAGSAVEGAMRSRGGRNECPPMICYTITCYTKLYLDIVLHYSI